MGITNKLRDGVIDVKNLIDKQLFYQNKKADIKWMDVFEELETNS